MSEENFNAPEVSSSESGISPWATLEPMVDATAPPKEEEPTFTGDRDGLQNAADELVKSREQSSQDEPFKYEYKIVGGEHEGEPVPLNQTVTAETAARNLADFRNAAQQQAENDTANLYAQTVDYLRAAAQGQQPAEQQQPVEQQQPPELRAQPVEVPEGVDPEIARVLAENPKLTAALQEKLLSQQTQVETAHQAYIQGLAHNAEIAKAALFSAFPEMASVPAGQLEGALRVLAQRDPARAQTIINHIQNAETLHQQARQAQAEEHQRQLARYNEAWQAFTKAEDDKFDSAATQIAPEYSTEDGKTRIAKGAVAALKNLGVSDDDLTRLWNGQASISLRDHRAQLLLLKAAKYDEIRSGVQNKLAPRPVPPVLRPGASESRPSGYDADADRAGREFNSNPNIKSAAAYLAARRAAAR